MAPIDSFRNSHRFLSNFYPSVVYLDGIAYPTVEHAYQASKTENAAVREDIRLCLTPGLAKQMGRTILIREGWHNYRVPTMESLLRQKFSKKDLADALLNTEERELIEGNTWNDTFWGVCRGTGQNVLGKLLMKIRGDLKDEAGKIRGS